MVWITVQVMCSPFLCDQYIFKILLCFYKHKKAQCGQNICVISVLSVHFFILYAHLHAQQNSKNTWIHVFSLLANSFQWQVLRCFSRVSLPYLHLFNLYQNSSISFLLIFSLKHIVSNRRGILPLLKPVLHSKLTNPLTILVLNDARRMK